MAKPDTSDLAWRMAAGLASARTEGDAAGAVARAAATLTGAESVHVWLIDHVLGYRFAGAWPSLGDPPEAPPSDLPRTVAFGDVALAEGSNGSRSQLIVPLARGTRPLGGLVLNESSRAKGPFTEKDTASLASLIAAADEALPALRERFKRRQRQAEAVVRLTRLFDMGRSLTAAGNIEELQELLADRVRVSLEVENAYLWRPAEGQEGKITVTAAAGNAAEAVQGWVADVGEGVAGQVFESGEALLVSDPEDLAALEGRPDSEAGLEIHSIAAAPLLSDEGNVEAVLEVVNAEGADPYMEEDHLAFLQEVTRTGVVALGNALRLQAEKRAGDLGSLLEAVQALSETLNVDRIAFTLVHQSASILSYQRSAVGLYRGTRFELRAVSGQPTVDEKQPEMRRLKEMLEWAAGLDEGILVVQDEEGEIDTPRPEAKEKFKTYFEETGARTFLAVPLKDEEGRLGVFALEAADAYAFEARDIEVVELLTATTTTAVRNATLYETIPKLFEPLGKVRHKVKSTPIWKRASWLTGTVIAIVVLFLIPFPLRVGGEARVLSELRRPVIAEVEGRITQVLVREGDEIESGQVVALLDDTELRAGEQEARARYEIALREQSRLRARGRTADAAIEAARIDGLKAELDLWHSRLERTRIRSVATGVIATPRVEEAVGSRLERGAIFCEVVDPERQRIEVAVYEQDAALVNAGMPVKVKLRAYPTKSFRAEIEKVGVAAAEIEGERVFLVRARLLDAPAILRTGMTGEAKISTGPASLAHIALRRPGRWLWGLLWGWLP